MRNRSRTVPPSTRASVCSGTLTTMDGSAFARAGVKTAVVRQTTEMAKWRSLIFYRAEEIPQRANSSTESVWEQLQTLREQNSCRLGGHQRSALLRNVACPSRRALPPSSRIALIGSGAHCSHTPRFPFPRRQRAWPRRPFVSHDRVVTEKRGSGDEVSRPSYARRSGNGRRLLVR